MYISKPCRDLLGVSYSWWSILLVSPPLGPGIRNSSLLDHRMARACRQLDGHPLHQFLLRHVHHQRHQYVRRHLCRERLASGDDVLGGHAAVHRHQCVWEQVVRQGEFEHSIGMSNEY